RRQLLYAMTPSAKQFLAWDSAGHKMKILFCRNRMAKFCGIHFESRNCDITGEWAPDV
ncbi:unnamed protein product, partial [Effrenium voratum]